MIGAVRLKRSHRPLKAKDILTWLEPYISLATVHLAFAKLRHKGIPVKPSWRDRDVLAAMEELIRMLAREVERGRLDYDRALEILLALVCRGALTGQMVKKLVGQGGP